MGRASFDAVQSMIRFGAVQGESPSAPGFSDGWWGYVDKDLRTLYTPNKVAGGELGRVFCGGGSKKACRTAMRSSLKAALAVTPDELYGRGACTDEPTPACWDRNRPRVTAAINKPGAFPFQNRPTFQQVVSVKRPVKR